MDWWAVLQIVIGASITIVFVVWLENTRKPKLVLRIEDSPVDVTYQDRPAKNARFRRLIIENKEPPRIVKWLSRNTAVRCYGFITFYHLDGQDVFGRSMPIKWANLPGVQLSPDGKLEMYTFDSVKHIDVHAGYTEILDVAARYDNDNECYGWCYESYFSNPPWRNPDWRLTTGRYLAKVEVICAGERCVGLYRLINDVPVNAFRLEPAQSTDYERIFKKP